MWVCLLLHKEKLSIQAAITIHCCSDNLLLLFNFTDSVIPGYRNIPGYGPTVYIKESLGRFLFDK